MLLNKEDIKRFEEKGKLFCKVEKTSPDIKIRKFPLWLYLCDEDEPRQDELGKWKDDCRQKFELYISKRRLEEIKQRK